MVGFIGRRILYMFPLLLVVTLIIFLLMKLQPGDVVDVLCGLNCSSDLRAHLKEKYGLNSPWTQQYLTWLYGIVGQPGLNYDESGNIIFPFVSISTPDFGYSPRMNMTALQVLIGENRWMYTLMLLLVSMVISWLIAIPIGIYSATHKYSSGDHLFTFLGFVGLSVPNFILALLFMWVVVIIFRLGQVDQFFGVGGFYNYPYDQAPMSFMKFLNFLWHFMPPVLILAAANTSAIIRYMRASLLDVLSLAYVQTARAKGLKEHIVVYKHAVRNAINPLISMLGFWIPYMMEGALVVAVAFNLPQIEKSFFDGISNRDYAVVVSGLFLFSVILMVGNLISDILLALSDPKIRYD
ncbi:ABC transporter permease [Candidatus Acetothermia bacterium]|nr:ABC transporter permease [Candidatus Acetothermia bacterium]MBI3643129.1 ABC transporter permease [Candidatus Acetothermia bacterium]